MQKMLDGSRADEELDLRIDSFIKLRRELFDWIKIARHETPSEADSQYMANMNAYVLNLRVTARGSY